MDAKQRINILSTGLACFVVGLDLAIVNTVIAPIQVSLHASINQMPWGALLHFG